MRAFHYGLNGGPHTHRPWSALRHRHKRRPASRDWRSAQHWRARSEHAMAFAQFTMKRRKGEETLAYVKECDAESGDGAPLYTQHGRVERFSSGYWEYREVPASCAQGPREAREAPRRPPAPFELPLPMASLESAAVCGVGRRFVAGVSPARSVVCESGRTSGAGLLGFVRVSPCVSVNVNMTHATTGATTLLLPVQNTHTLCIRHDAP